MSTEIMTVNDALAMVQAELNVPKGKRANIFGGYDYRNAEDILQALKPILPKVGGTVTITYDITQMGDRVYVKATATLTVKDGSISCPAFAREPESKKGTDESQLTGAASSYAAKTALGGLFMIDDNKDADETNDHGLTLAYVGRLQSIRDTYPPKFIKVAMSDYKLNRMTDLPETECDNFEQLIKGLSQSEEAGEL